jgi:hypothetical protein
MYPESTNMRHNPNSKIIICRRFIATDNAALLGEELHGQLMQLL